MNPAADLVSATRTRRVWAVLATVPDPELPTVSVCDLGIVRAVRDDGGTIEVVLTPTYSGCPAIEAIEHDIRAALSAAGLAPTRVVRRRAPAWTSDWISPAGRAKLAQAGIAPPGAVTETETVPIRFAPRRVAAPLACPRCGSVATEQLAAFGSTACKALHRCLACREPFEHFKAI